MDDIRYTAIVLLMVIEHFRDGNATRVHERFVARGRMLPDGVVYHASWIDPARTRCFQLMEAPSAAAIQPWIAAWSDIVEFEVIPVVTSAEYWTHAAG